MPKRSHGYDLLDLNIVKVLRTNARLSLRKVAELLEAPISTVFTRAHKLERDVIARYTTLLNVPAVMPIRAWLWIRTRPTHDECLRYLLVHPTINTLCRVGPKSLLVAEGFFSSMNELEHEIATLSRRGAKKVKVRFVTESVKRREFLAFQDL